VLPSNGSPVKHRKGERRSRKVISRRKERKSQSGKALILRSRVSRGTKKKKTFGKVNKKSEEGNSKLSKKKKIYEEIKEGGGPEKTKKELGEGGLSTEEKNCQNHTKWGWRNRLLEGGGSERVKTSRRGRFSWGLGNFSRREESKKGFVKLPSALWEKAGKGG